MDRLFGTHTCVKIVSPKIALKNWSERRIGPNPFVSCHARNAKRSQRSRLSQPFFLYHARNAKRSQRSLLNIYLEANGA